MNTSYAKLLMVLATVVALSSSGCTNASSCSRGTDATTVDFEPSMLTGNTYHSAPVGGPYTFYPGGRTITFKHGLGQTPLDPLFYLAFSPYGGLALSTGNETEILPVDGETPPLDDDHIRVYNDTCSDFYIWVTASAPEPVVDADAGGAAGAAP